jgi:predicted DNA-binding protein (MmcQ/YjbR family)
MNDGSTDVMKTAARALEDVNESTACNQASFKHGTKSFFFTGPAQDEFKAMFTLADSMDEARALAVERPERVGAGKTRWGSVKFSADEPMDEALWQKWLAESYALAGPKRKK